MTPVHDTGNDMRRGPGAPALGWMLYIAGCVAWATFDIALPNIYGATDVFHFKDPACNLAEGRGFVSASFVGSDSFDERLWFSQGPLFPLFYEAYAAIAGCSFTADNIFDLAVSALLGGLILTLMRPAFSNAMWVSFAAALAIMVPTGAFTWPGDRPDHLALCIVLGVPLLFAATGGGWKRSSAAGLLAGLAFVTSPYYGILALGLTAALYLTEPWPGMRGATADGVFCAAAFGAPPLVAVACFYAADPESIWRFLHHTSLILETRTTFTDKLLHAFDSAGISSRMLFLKWLGTVLFAGWMIRLSLRPAGRRCALPCGALLVILIGTPLIFPRQVYYLAAAATVSLAIFPVFLAATSHGTPFERRALAGSAIFLMLLPLVPLGGIGILQRIQSHDSFAEQYRRVTANRNAGTGIVVVPAIHYFMYKPFYPRLFDREYLSDTHDRREVAMTALCRTVRPLSEPFPPTGTVMPGEVDRSEIPAAVAISLAGHTLMSRDWGWGCLLLKGFR